MSLLKKLSGFCSLWSSLPPSRRIELLTLIQRLTVAVGVVVIIALLVHGCR